MAEIGIKRVWNHTQSSLLVAREQRKSNQSEEQKAEAALNKAFANLGAFERSSAWTGAGENADVARHNALKGEVEIARANVAKTGVNLADSDNNFEQQQRLNSGLGQNLNLIG
ncbi:MAG: hypothetical protein WCG95_03810 [bacterium]